MSSWEREPWPSDVVDGPLVELWEQESAGLVLRYPSGVRYGNQTGGFSCLQDAAEGFYAPLGAVLAACLCELSLARWGGAGATRGLTEADADAIDHVLATYVLVPSPTVRVDRRRLKECHEAWVYVRVSGWGDLPLVVGVGDDTEGILTWPNSD